MGIALDTGTRKSARGRGRGRGRHSRPMGDINVTPFVDVMLVLLIVFMVTAPLLTVGVPVDLPQTRAPALGQDAEPLAVSVDSSGQIFLQDTPVVIEELVPRLQAIAENGYDQRVFVRGDRTVEYGKVAEVMGLLSSAGFTRIGLVNQGEDIPQR
ncbi:MAG: protein TolR [Pseudomonadota bacterium]|jgi:biopolymer transport protein TolR